MYLSFCLLDRSYSTSFGQPECITCFMRLEPNKRNLIDTLAPVQYIHNAQMATNLPSGCAINHFEDCFITILLVHDPFSSPAYLTITPLAIVESKVPHTLEGCVIQITGMCIP